MTGFKNPQAALVGKIAQSGDALIVSQITLETFEGLKECPYPKKSAKRHQELQSI